MSVDPNLPYYSLILIWASRDMLLFLHDNWLVVHPNIAIAMFGRILLQDSVVDTGSCGQIGLDLVIDR